MSEWKKYELEVRDEQPYVPRTFGDLFTTGDEGERGQEQPYTPPSLFGRRPEADESDAYVPPRLFEQGGRE